MLTPNINNEITTNDVFNLFMVSKFPNLNQMYLNAIEDVKNEKAIELYNGWLEWHQLDDESKQFVNKYLNR